jgi:hypothetical protein
MTNTNGKTNRMASCRELRVRLEIIAGQLFDQHVRQVPLNTFTAPGKSLALDDWIYQSHLYLCACRRFGRVRLCADMPAPQRNRVQVVRCKGCKRCIPISVEAVIGSVTVVCPVCMERRSYIISTEVFLGQPSWEAMRVLQGRR